MSMRPSKYCRVLCLLIVVGAGVLPLEEQLFKRNSDNSSPLSGNIEDSFVTNLRQSLEEVNTLQSPFLVHSQENLLVFVNRTQGRTSLAIPTTIYDNLKAISHLPVTAVSILIPELLSNGGSVASSQLSISTKQRLEDFRRLVQNLAINSTGFTSEQQYTQQREIRDNVMSFVKEVLDSQSLDITMDTLDSFTDPLVGPLRSNSQDAVSNYLRCLNATISSLGISQQTLTKDLVVILSVEPFSRRGSFLFQYYLQLLNIDSQSKRLILLPSSSTCNSTQNNTLFSTTLHQSITQLFYGNNSTPVHRYLSQAATNLICSDSFVLPSCIPEASVEGFHTRLEKSYVVLMMLFGGIAVLFGIVLGCITYEERLMASQRRKNENAMNLKLEGPNVFTPVSSISEADDSIVVQSPEERSRQPTYRRPLLSSDSNSSI